MHELGFPTLGNRSACTMADIPFNSPNTKKHDMSAKFSHTIDKKKQLKASTSQKTSPTYHISRPLGASEGRASLGLFAVSPPGAHLVKKGAGYYTASTLQTESVASSEMTAIGRPTELQKEVKQLTLQDYEWQGQIISLAHFGDEEDPFIGEEELLDRTKSREHPKVMRGYLVHERNEQKFFLPKTSVIFGLGFTQIDPSTVFVQAHDHEVERESICMFPQSEEDCNLETPSFTHLHSEGRILRSNDFTFGRESEEEVAGKESGTSSLQPDWEKTDSMQGSLDCSDTYRKVQTQRVQEKERILNRSMQVEPQREGLLMQEESDVPDSQDSERYNLYRHHPISDKDEIYYPNSPCELQRSVDLSEKVGLYNRSAEVYEVDSSQFFLDDELRSKYESVLQHN